jgi:hypothetical protein
LAHQARAESSNVKLVGLAGVDTTKGDDAEVETSEGGDEDSGTAGLNLTELV